MGAAHPHYFGVRNVIHLLLIWKEKLYIHASKLELYCLLASFTCNFKIVSYCPLQFYSSCHYCILNLVSLCHILEVWFRSSYQGTLNPNCSKHTSSCHRWAPFGKFELVHSLIFFQILRGARFLCFSPFFVLPIFSYFLDVILDQCQVQDLNKITFESTIVSIHLNS